MARIVRCNWCFWEGTETSLIPGEKECCPHCGESGYLMDMYETDDEEETEYIDPADLIHGIIERLNRIKEDLPM